MSDNMDEPDYDWITADGQRLKYSEMTTSHIQNCIKMLERQLAKRPIDYAPDSGDNDGVYWALISEQRHNERVATGIEKTIEELKKELKERV